MSAGSPEIVQATIRGTTLRLTFDAPIQCGRSGCRGITVRDETDSRPLPVFSARVTESQVVTMELDAAAKPGHDIRVSYGPGNLVGTDSMPLPGFGDVAASNLSGPSPVSLLSVQATPIVTELRFSGTVRCGGLGCKGFTTRTAQTGAPSTPYAVDVVDALVKLEHDAAVTGGEVYISYLNGNLVDANGDPIGDFGRDQIGVVGGPDNLTDGIAVLWQQGPIIMIRPGNEEACGLRGVCRGLTFTGRDILSSAIQSNHSDIMIETTVGVKNSERICLEYVPGNLSSYTSEQPNQFSRYEKPTSDCFQTNADQVGGANVSQVTAVGTEVNFAFSEEIQCLASGCRGFHVLSTASGSEYPVVSATSYADGSGRRYYVRALLGKALTPGDDLTVQYANGNVMDYLGRTAREVASTRISHPTAWSTVTPYSATATGSDVLMPFSGNVVCGSAICPGFTVRDTISNETVEIVSADRPSQDSIRLELARAVGADDGLRVTYSPGTLVDEGARVISPFSVPIEVRSIATLTPTATATDTATATPTLTLTPTASPTFTASATMPLTATATGTAAAIASPTPPSTATPTPGVCAPRPPVNVVTTTPAYGRLSVVVLANTLPATPSNWLRRIRFERLDNASVDVRTIASQQRPFTIELPDRPRSVGFLVTWATPGPFTARLVVEDDCGEWRTFVGAGANAF